jgi:Uma2 family endonuclease
MEAVLQQAEKQGVRYTYEDYAAWELMEGERYELYDGVPFRMWSPSREHQRVSGEIYRQLANYLRGKTCEVISAPFDVCLSAKGDRSSNVVQPDIIVVCDEKKLENGKYCNGAPDVVIEILSPSSSTNDLFIKLDKYKAAGVVEYWVVEPLRESARVDVFILSVGNTYEVTTYIPQKHDRVPVFILPGCEIDLREVWV